MAAPLEQMQQEMAAKDIDAAFLLKPHNVFYFGGYASVCSGVVLFPDQEPVYCILWLDLPEAKQACTISTINTYVYPRESLTGRMIQIAVKQKAGIRRIGVEKDFMQIRQLELLQRHFPGHCCGPGCGASRRQRTGGSGRGRVRYEQGRLPAARFQYLRGLR